MSEAGERWGILGGTFDPPHVAHVALAEAARRQYDLDRVLLVVAADPWQKRGRVDAPALDRRAMVAAAIEGHPGLEVSDVELDRPGPTYTADTLEELAAPGRHLFLIVGADTAAGLSTWHRPERVRELATVLVAARPEGRGPVEELVARLHADGWTIGVVAIDELAISSTDIRRHLRAGTLPDGAVPEAVMRVIEERGLYTRPR